jgi:hypothetical protein
LKGPPQLSTFARSSSESSSDELSTVVKQNDEKPSSEIVKKSESSPEKKDNNEEEEDTTDNAGFIGFLQLIQAMSGGTIRAPSTNDDGDGIQSLLARLGIVTRKFLFPKFICLLTYI